MMLLLQQHILKQQDVWVFDKAAHEWYTQGFGETILLPLVFPDVGPSGHAQEKPTAAGAAKSAAAPEKTILIDSDGNDIPIPSGQQDNTDQIADNEQEFQSGSVAAEKKKKSAATKGNATTEATPVPEPAPSHLAPKSTWTRRKLCVVRPPHWQRLKRMHGERMREKDEEDEEEEEDIQVPRQNPIRIVST